MCNAYKIANLSFMVFYPPPYPKTLRTTPSHAIRSNFVFTYVKRGAMFMLVIITWNSVNYVEKQQQQQQQQIMGLKHLRGALLNVGGYQVPVKRPPLF